MKPNKQLFAFAVLAIFSATLIVNACRKSTDLTSGISPRVKPDKDVVHLVNDQLHHAKNAAERKAILDSNTWVVPRVVRFAKELGMISQKDSVDSVVFCWGSKEAQAQDSTGKWFKGKFVDQLVAFLFVHGRDVKKPVGVLVICTNGVITSLEGLERIGMKSTVFTVEAPYGLNRYVSYKTAMYIGEYFKLPVYRGKGDARHPINYMEARSLEGTLDENFVYIPVYPGTVFNLDNMSMTVPGRKSVR